MTTPTNDQVNANGKRRAAYKGKPKGGKVVFAPGANGRSRVTNGKQLFVETSGVDRSWSRRFADIIVLHTNDLGGADYVSAAEASIIRRAAAESVELELLEQRFAKNGKGASAEDLDLYARISNSLRRRVARDITPDLKDYLAQRATTEDQADVEIEEADSRSP
jgi:hypothetical protein